MRITRRSMFGLLAGAGSGVLGKLMPAASAQVHPLEDDSLPIAKGPFQGTRESLRSYQVPEWYRDAKFGIWAHWGPQSAIEDGDWYARNMYIQGSDQYNYHVQRYGHPSKFGYKDTILFWKAQSFDPMGLIRAYKKAGAKYFVSMGVHHDNFDMWNSKYHKWNVVAMGPHKDIVGMWRDAARSEGLRFGVSEHLWIAYKWFSVSHGSDLRGPLADVPYDGANPAYQDLYIRSDQIWRSFPDSVWNEDGIPLWWKRQWFRRMKDLLDNYQPDLLSSDGALPFEEYGLSAVANLYNLSAQRSGGKVEAVYFSKRPEDCERGTCVLVKERGVFTNISARPWETDTCIGDWHYKLGMKYKSPKRIVDILVDVVSRNGNLLLNFPLPASGELDLEEKEILAAITDWMAINGEGIFGTRPWEIAGEGPPEQEQGPVKFNEEHRRDLTAADVRFTTKASVLYVFVMGWPDYKITVQSLAQDTALRVGKVENVELLGTGQKLQFQQNRTGLIVFLPKEAPSRFASAFKVMGAI